MLAGYLPFDDDPANPDGDNINLLYKYIVSTPLTFPEYVTPHARDLLKRILVPDPRKRADLFEVARHSWLSDYAHVVSFITSSANTSNDAQKAQGLNSESFPKTLPSWFPKLTPNCRGCIRHSTHARKKCLRARTGQSIAYDRLPRGRTHGQARTNQPATIRKGQERSGYQAQDCAGRIRGTSVSDYSRRSITTGCSRIVVQVSCQGARAHRSALYGRLQCTAKPFSSRSNCRDIAVETGRTPKVCIGLYGFWRFCPCFCCATIHRWCTRRQLAATIARKLVQPTFYRDCCTNQCRGPILSA